MVATIRASDSAEGASDATGGASAADADAARRYLELLRTTPSRSLGPFREFGGSSEPAELQELGRRVAAAVQRLDSHTYRAPSPWHAAAYLLDVCFLIGCGVSAEMTRGLQAPYEGSQGTPVFRGQATAAWEVRAGIYREPLDPDDWIALNIYTDAVASLFRDDESRMLGRYAHLAEAQHYGLRTHLLDFTADPRVAVYFACRDREIPDGVEAAVYFAPMNLLAGIGGAVVLPPPWVRRLYAQRGLFVDAAKLPNERNLGQGCLRMLFPRSAEFAETEFGEASKILEPPDPWYESAIAWARAKAKTFELDQADTLAPSLLHECGSPPFLWDSLRPAAMNDVLDDFTDMCEWLALKVKEGTYHYDLSSMDVLLQHNAPFLRSLRITWKIFAGQLGPASGAMRHDRRLAAMEAVARSVEDAARAGWLPPA